MNGGAVTPWEAHFRKAYMNGMKPEIARMIKCTCVTWDSCKLSITQAHAIHAENLLKDNWKKRDGKDKKELHMAMMTMFHGAARGHGCGHGKGDYRGRGCSGYMGRGQRDHTSYDMETCFICGENGHWSRECTKNKKAD